MPTLLKPWRTNKIVNAARIEAINTTETGAILTLDASHVEPGSDVRVEVSEAWVAENSPAVGGYLVESGGAQVYVQEDHFRTVYSLCGPPTPEAQAAIVLLNSLAQACAHLARIVETY